MDIFKLIGLALVIAVAMILIGLSVYLGFIFYFITRLFKKFMEKFR